jgi:arsenate reductase
VETAAQRLGEPVEIVEYLKTPPTLSTLRQLHTMLGVPVRDMIRDGETSTRNWIWPIPA